jgi:hypothetical protein
MVVGRAAFVSKKLLLAICGLEGTIRTSSSSKLWTNVHKLAEYNVVNREVSASSGVPMGIPENGCELGEVADVAVYCK